MKICFIFLLTLIAFAEVSFACTRTEIGTPVCAFWTRADAVFAGKVTQIEGVPNSEDYPANGRKIRFQVVQNFKGADNPTFTLITADRKTDCGLNAKKGETWIIYARNDIVLKSFQDFRGVKINPKETSDELETLKNIVAGKTSTAIAGRIASDTASGKYNHEAVEIAVEGKNFKQTATTDADGAFNVAVPTDGSYKIELKLPYRAALKWDESLLGANFAEGVSSLFKYEVRLNDGDCHFAFFEATKK